jgi:non-ribosomal peptide synthetase component F
MTLLAAFRALLAKATGQADLVIGTPIANRNHKEIEGLIGFFVNTLALRCDVRPDESFRSLLAREKASALAAYDHQDAPFELVVDALQLPRRLDLTPLFQVWFVHQNLPREALAQTTYQATAHAEAASKFDVTLYSVEEGAEIRLVWHYNPELFDEASITQLIADYQVLLASVAAEPAVRIDHLGSVRGRRRGATERDRRRRWHTALDVRGAADARRRDRGIPRRVRCR